MPQSENESIDKYLEVIPSDELTDYEVADLALRVRQGDGDAFTSLVRSNIKPLMQLFLKPDGVVERCNNKRMPPLSTRVSRLDLLISVSVGLAKAVGGLIDGVDSKPLTGKSLRSRAVVHTLRAARVSNDTRRLRLRPTMRDKVSRAVTSFIQANDRLPSPDELVEQIQIIEGPRAKEAEAYSFAKSIFGEYSEFRKKVPVCEFINSHVEYTLSAYPEVDAIKISLSERCVTTIVGDVCAALTLPAESAALANDHARSMLIGVPFYLTCGVALN